jgi:hypothetical protein
VEAIESYSDATVVLKLPRVDTTITAERSILPADTRIVGDAGRIAFPSRLVETAVETAVVVVA